MADSESVERAEARWAVQRLALDAWRRWGYRLVDVPICQREDDWTARGLRSGMRPHRFIGSDGEVLVLRPDMTLPIARLAAGEMGAAPRPLRLCYAGSVFRRGPDGAPQEIVQIGVELVGGPSPQADAEIVGLAVETLERLRVDRFCLAVGHVGVLQSLLADVVPDGAVDAVLSALQARDFVALDRAAGVAPGVLRRRIAAASAALDGSGPAWDDLRAALDLLGQEGFGRRLVVDLGLVRDFRYYTGLVFDVVVEGVPHPVGGGGRYDGLAGEPATGFAFAADALAAVCGCRPEPPARILVVALPGAAVDAWQVAATLRAEGRVVELEVSGRTPEGVAAAARAAGVAEVLAVAPGGRVEPVPVGGMVS
ncbi:MAG: ATP phosphoribosyltransferase regulatory subunit [Clostridia bacterium]|nr:ATP phosphoribosyltransferase regulatory subunit [Clostridia bacterium]